MSERRLGNVGGGTILLLLRHISQAQPIAFGIFFLGGIKGPSRATAPALVTLMIVMLYVSGYFKPLARAQPSTLERNDLSFFLPVEAWKSQKDRGDLASKMDQEADTDQAKRGTLTAPQSKARQTFLLCSSQQQKEQKRYSLPLYRAWQICFLSSCSRTESHLHCWRAY